MTMTWIRLRGIYNTVFILSVIDISMRRRSGMCVGHLTPLGDIQSSELCNMVTSFELELSHAANRKGWMSVFQGSVWVRGVIIICVRCIIKLLVDATSFHRYIKWSILVSNKTVCHGCKIKWTLPIEFFHVNLPSDNCGPTQIFVVLTKLEF